MQDWRRFKNPFDTVTGTNTHTHPIHGRKFCLKYLWAALESGRIHYEIRDNFPYTNNYTAENQAKRKSTAPYNALLGFTMLNALNASWPKEKERMRERERKWTKGSNKDVHQSTRKMIEGENVQMCCLFQFQAPGRFFFPCAIVVKPDAKRIGLNGTHRGKNEKCLNHRTCLITSDSIPLQLPSS